MSSITLRRCVADPKTGKTFYDHVVDDGNALGEFNLACHEFGVTFFRDEPIGKGNIFYHKAEGAPFSVNFIAEIGSEAQGTWMASYPKKTPPLYKLPYKDGNSKSHRMVLALRCPTDAPTELASTFQNAAAVYDTLRAADEKLEADNNESFEITHCVECTGDSVKDIVVLARLEPTYEVPYANDTAPSTPRTPRRRVSKVASTGAAENAGDTEMPAPAIKERKIGDTYPPSVLSDHRGPCFEHDKAVVTQRDYTDANGNLIAPSELYSTLTEGTLVLVTVYFATYVMKDLKTDRGDPQVDRKVYHLIIDKLKVLDRGNGEPWDPPVPTMPERRTYSPGASPRKRARDDATDAAFNNFGKGAAQAPKRRRTGGR
ncbi:hypothetical protein C8F04DRAFT_1110354 [Mycena alexandri]|uniref:Uncharacterized protein n=1 Tax=Mycena alexandri TaxID=1745969 RepID=A0AAD6SP44_9AGAR|nr:hypothetical protein C8F04DRAFT_1110354 [Mycena alexandri]